MTHVRRLITTVDEQICGPKRKSVGRTLSVSALHEAELDDGSRVLLLDDRGWSSSALWSESAKQEIIDTSRDVVGPDEPYGDQTYEEAALAHWEYLAAVLARAGIIVQGAKMRLLPHDVILTRQVMDRIQGR